VEEQQAHGFAAVNDIAMHEPVTEEPEEQVDNEEVTRIGMLQRLLTIGQEKSAEGLERVLAGV
jgi:hypothetical protein